MNKHNAHLYLPLVQALAEGKTIQHKSDIWLDLEDATFVDDPKRYRIKPEPREWKACIVTKESKERGSYVFREIGDLVSYDEGDENEGYEVIRVREITE